jgi:acetoin utilization protein AcuB
MTTRPMPKVREFMTRTPHSVSNNASLSEVRELLHKLSVRHLPVLRDAEVVGVISSRSVSAASVLPRANLLKAEDIMTSEPYRVSPQEDLDEVAAVMAEDKFGCAIVEEAGKLVGIFTTVDACRALRQVLETFYPA